MKSNTTRIIAGAVVAVAAAAGVALAVTSSSPPTGSACQADPSAVIAALPSGGTFHGSGCYSVPNGLHLTKPITIDGGSYVDSSTVPGPHGLSPVIAVRATHDVTLENLSVTGGNPTGAYKPNLVGQAGITVLSSSGVTISNVTTSSTFGDGLELWALLPQDKTPTNHLTVTNLKVTLAGRQGITTGDLSDATFTNVTVVSDGFSGIDGESDTKAVGMGNVSFDHLTATGVNLVEYLTGPITFTNSTLNGHFVAVNKAGTFGVTVTDSSWSMRAQIHGYPPGGIYQNGGTLTFQRTRITRSPGNYVGNTWNVVNGGHLDLLASPVIGPAGVSDATSSVTVVP